MEKLSYIVAPSAVSSLRDISQLTAVKLTEGGVFQSRGKEFRDFPLECAIAAALFLGKNNFFCVLAPEFRSVLIYLL